LEKVKDNNELLDMAGHYLRSIKHLSYKQNIAILQQFTEK